MFDENPIHKMVNKLDAKFKALSKEDLAVLEDAAKMDAKEWIAFGDKPTRAMVAGIIDLEVATALHSIHSRYQHGATLAEKIIFNQMMKVIYDTGREF